MSEQSGSSGSPHISDAEIQQLLGGQVWQMDFAQIRALMLALAEALHRDGIEVVEGRLDDMLPDDDSGDDLLTLGLRLALADRADPSLIADILQTRVQTDRQQQQTRCNMIMEGVAALQAGDSPRIVGLKLQSHYDV